MVSCFSKSGLTPPHARNLRKTHIGTFSRARLQKPFLGAPESSFGAIWVPRAVPEGTDRAPGGSRELVLHLQMALGGASCPWIGSTMPKCASNDPKMMPRGSQTEGKSAKIVERAPVITDSGRSQQTDSCKHTNLHILSKLSP